MTNRPSVTTSIPGQIDLIEEVIASFPRKGHILDIGTGSGLAARRFHEENWQVTATGFDMDAYLGEAALPDGIRVLADVDVCRAKQFSDGEFNAIWCAHVLEHVSNTGLALRELRRMLKPGGWLFIAVPPYKEQVVGGHVNVGWNVGSLMYVLADAGFGLVDGRFIHHGYNVFGMVKRGPGRLSGKALRRANGDIEVLAEAGRFPKDFPAKQGFHGRRRAVNWLWNRPPLQIPAPRSELARPPAIPPMKIGFVLPWITMGRNCAEDVGQRLVNAMAALGHGVVVFTFDDRCGPSSWPLNDGITLVHLSEADDEISDTRMAVEVDVQNLDLLVALHQNSTVLRVVRCAQRLGLPLVLSEQADPRFRNWRDTCTPEQRDIAMAGASLIHVPMDGYAEALDPSVRGKVRVIPATVREPQTLARPGADKNTRTLLAVSRLIPRKNLATVIDAFARLAADFPDWRLQIVGDGPSRDELAALADHYRLGDRIELTGDRDDVYPFYADADLFVNPTVLTTFPHALCAAIAHGLPAVGLDACAGTRAQIVQGETGLLCQDDQSETLEAAFRKLMQDTKALGRMGKAAKAHFQAQFSNNVVDAAWNELFAEAKARPTVACGPPDHATLMAVRLWETVWGSIDDPSPVRKQKT